MKKDLMSRLKSELLKMVDEDYRQGVKNYFNTKIDNYGVRTGEVRKLARRYYQHLPIKPSSTYLTL